MLRNNLTDTEIKQLMIGLTYAIWCVPSIIGSMIISFEDPSVNNKFSSIQPYIDQMKKQFKEQLLDIKNGGGE